MPCEARGGRAPHGAAVGILRGKGFARLAMCRRSAGQCGIVKLYLQMRAGCAGGCTSCAGVGRCSIAREWAMPGSKGGAHKIDMPNNASCRAFAAAHTQKRLSPCLNDGNMHWLCLPVQLMRLGRLEHFGDAGSALRLVADAAVHKIRRALGSAAARHTAMRTAACAAPALLASAADLAHIRLSLEHFGDAGSALRLAADAAVHKIRRALGSAAARHTAMRTAACAARRYSPAQPIWLISGAVWNTSVMRLRTPACH